MHKNLQIQIGNCATMIEAYKATNNGLNNSNLFTNKIIVQLIDMYWNDENQSAIKPVLLEYGEAYDRKSLGRFLNSRSTKRMISLYKGLSTFIFENS